MAFQAGDRVRITSQASQFRGHYGTVTGTNADGVLVRLDGFPAHQSELMAEGELQTSTQACPVTYPS